MTMIIIVSENAALMQKQITKHIFKHLDNL